MSEKEVFCEKKLYVVSMGEELHIKIFKPEKSHSHPDYECHFEVTSKSGQINLKNRGFGVDSVQSVVGAFMFLGAQTVFWNLNYFNGELTSLPGEKEPFPESFGFIKNWPDYK